MEKVYIKYDKKTLPTCEAIIPNQIEKEVKAFSRAICVTNEANQNLTPSLPLNLERVIVEPIK